MRIVPMNQTHLKDLEQVEALCFDTPWTAEQLGEELEHEFSVFWVAEYEQKAVGYIGCQTTIDGGYITNVAVHPEFRGQGIAQALIDALHQSVQQLDFVTLEVRQSNEVAKKLYQKMGYCPVGVRKNFYRNPTEDAILMTYNIPKEEQNENSCD